MSEETFKWVERLETSKETKSTVCWRGAGTLDRVLHWQPYSAFCPWMLGICRTMKQGNRRNARWLKILIQIRGSWILWPEGFGISLWQKHPETFRNGTVHTFQNFWRSRATADGFLQLQDRGGGSLTLLAFARLKLGSLKNLLWLKTCNNLNPQLKVHSMQIVERLGML